MWVPAMGPTGAKLIDLGPRKNHGDFNASFGADQWGVDSMGSYVIFSGGATDIIALERLVDLREFYGLTIIVRFSWDSSGSAEHTLVSNFNNTDPSFLLRLEPSNDTTEFFVIARSNDQDGGTFGAPNTVPVNEHVHLAVMVERPSPTTGLMTAVINGVRSATQSWGPEFDLSPPEDPMQFGASPATTADGLTGKLYSVAIYNRTLTFEELLDDYFHPYAALLPKPFTVGKAPEVVGDDPEGSLLGGKLTHSILHGRLVA